MEAERDALIDKRHRKIRQTGGMLAYGGIGVGTLAVLGWGWMLARQKTMRRRAVAQLREQIARDLHDDIGSNLGGIVLLSEMGSRHSTEPQAREDFEAIKVAADATSQSMQDIVWLIQRGNTGLRDLVTRMRQSARALLGEEVLALTVDPTGFSDVQLSLFFRRHVFFAFKETLNNVRKHAGATEVEARIVIEGRSLGFEVRDNGVGFNPLDLTERGFGLANLQRRANRLHGNFRLDSSPGAGTFVSFKAPIRDSS